MSQLRDWAELLRVSALFTVPGDHLAGAAAGGLRPGARTALAAGASLCLYEAGMALNDWADREEDAAERPHRPLPSGRISPAQALTAAAGLTAAGLGLARAAGRPAALVATALAGTVWAYDLKLKHTPAGPAAMAAARGLDLLLGAVATADSAALQRHRATKRATAQAVRRALPAAAALAAHTYAVTTVSRAETQGSSPARPLAALAATAALGALMGTRPSAGPPARNDNSRPPQDTPAAPRGGSPLQGTPAPPRNDGSRLPHSPHSPYSLPSPCSLRSPRRLAQAALAGAYVATAAKPLWHATLNPSPPLTQRAVGGGIRAMIPLQATLAARCGALGSAALLSALVPVARRLARKVSPT
ncbi:SCO3242 family prenyltransferase [Streptomyces sp. NPDC005728]|uniref:SCO3242 family prenyltransferase n=1 Tax=Streptomyces sp. NPDC005728 TaxID=3157054 RepID=UPI0033D9EF2E